MYSQASRSPRTRTRRGRGRRPDRKGAHNRARKKEANASPLPRKKEKKRAQSLRTAPKFTVHKGEGLLRYLWLEHPGEESRATKRIREALKFVDRQQGMMLDLGAVKTEGGHILGWQLTFQVRCAL